jgi:hypothetical protein
MAADVEIGTRSRFKGRYGLIMHPPDGTGQSEFSPEKEER